MRLITKLTIIASSMLLLGCISKGTNPDDPLESINRKTHKFNMAFDHVLLRPAAKVYHAVFPSFVRAGINNAYNNVNMLPTVANDLLQAKWNYAIKDTWRFIANSTFGIAGIVDVASTWSMPPHSNDLGLTFAQWGDKKSPYIVIPFLGPSTIRDGMGMMFDYAFFTPYPYINSNAAIYGILALRYVDLRSQMLDTDRLLDEGLDKYTFIREAYLQHRNYLITGEQAENGSLYVGDDDDKKAPAEKPANGTPSRFPLTTAKNATYSPPAA